MPDDNEEISESSTETQETETQENRVPQGRVDEIVARYKGQLGERDEELERLKKEVEGLKTQEGETTYSRAQLLQMVDEGQISQAQADEYWEQQIRQSVTQEASRAAEQRALAERIRHQVDGYKEIIPGLEEFGHDNRAKLQRKYNELVNLGHPNDARTEVVSLEAIFGPLDSLKKKKTGDELTRRGRDTHQETGEAPEGDSKDAVKNLDKRKKDYYQKMIDMGLYKDWGEVRKEVEQYG